MASALRHTGIVVEDLQVALDFYTGFFDFSVVQQNHEPSQFLDKILGLKGSCVTTVKMQDNRGNGLELLAFDSPKTKILEPCLHQQGLTHIAITVENIQALHHTLTSQRIHCIAPPTLAPDGKAKVCFCQGPNGEYIEMVEEVHASH